MNGGYAPIPLYIEKERWNMLFSKDNGVNANRMPDRKTPVLWRGIVACTMVISGCACMVLSLLGAKGVMLHRERE